MKTDLVEGAKNLTTTAQKLNDKAINTTETLVDETLAIGEQWQGLMKKALHAGVDIYAKQQDMTLTALEELKAQYLAGNDKLVKLLGLEGFKLSEWRTTFFNNAKKASATAANKVSTTILKAEEKIKSEAIKEIVENNKIEAAPKAKVVTKKAPATKKAVAKKMTTAKAKTTVAKATAKLAKTATAKIDTAEKAVKKTTTKVAKTTKKAVEKTAKTVAPKVAKDKLTLIEGIGPKIEEVLNNTGIMTYMHLSTYTVEALENILVEANPAYKRFQPTTWAAQAKIAADGNIEELKAWQKELKGGQIVK